MLRAGAPTAGLFRTGEVHTGVMGLGVRVSGWGDQKTLKRWKADQETETWEVCGAQRLRSTVNIGYPCSEVWCPGVCGGTRMRSWWEGAYFGSSWKLLREVAKKRFRFHSGQCSGGYWLN